MRSVTDCPHYPYQTYPDYSPYQAKTPANTERAIIPYVSTAEFVKKVAEKGLEEDRQQILFLIV